MIDKKFCFLFLLIHLRPPLGSSLQEKKKSFVSITPHALLFFLFFVFSPIPLMLSWRKLLQIAPPPQKRHVNFYSGNKPPKRMSH